MEIVEGETGLRGIAQRSVDGMGRTLCHFTHPFSCSAIRTGQSTRRRPRLPVGQSVPAKLLSCRYLAGRSEF